MSENWDACRPEWPVLLLNVLVASGPELQLRDLSGSVVLLKSGFMLMSEAPTTIKGHADIRGRVHVGVRGPYCTKASANWWPALPPGVVRGC